MAAATTGASLDALSWAGVAALSFLAGARQATPRRIRAHTGAPYTRLYWLAVAGYIEPCGKNSYRLTDYGQATVARLGEIV